MPIIKNYTENAEREGIFYLTNTETKSFKLFTILFSGLSWIVGNENQPFSLKQIQNSTQNQREQNQCTDSWISTKKFREFYMFEWAILVILTALTKIETKIAQTFDLSMSRVSGTPSINLSPFQITPVKCQTI